MDTQIEEFQQCWKEFEDAVMQKIPSNPGYEDPVLIVMRNNGCLFSLDENQIDKLALLGTIYQLIQNRIGTDEAISAALTEKSVSILRQITALIK